MRKTLVGAVLAVLTLAQSAAAEPYNLTLAGASPGGLWSLLGVGIDSAIKESYPNSTVTYQTSGGGLANISLLDRGSVEMGIVHDAELLLGKNGEAPFTQPIDSLRALAYLYNWSPVQLLISKSFADEYGIKTFADLAAKKSPVRVALNKRGNIASVVGEELLKAIGASQEKIDEWGGQVVYAASEEQSTLMRDRRVDLLINSLFLGHSSILQVAQAVDLRLLPLSEDTAIQVAAKTGTAPFTIPAGTYDFAPEETKTLTLGAALVVNENMSEEDAYNLTKALFVNYEKLAGVHKAMNELTPQIMASQNVIPYHAGAERYLKETGLK